VVVVVVKGERDGNQDKETLAPDSERHCTGPSGDQFKLKHILHQVLRCPGMVPICSNNRQNARPWDNLRFDRRTMGCKDWQFLTCWLLRFQGTAITPPN